MKDKRKEESGLDSYLTLLSHALTQVFKCTVLSNP